MRRMSSALDERFERTPFSVGPFHGHRTKRFHRLLARAPGSAELVMHWQVLEIVRAVLGGWCDFPEINLTQGVEVHPGAPAQIPHCDQSMWPAPKGVMELSVNLFWPLSPFTADNGATRVWPGTHASPQTAETVLGEPVVCEMMPGDVLIVLGSTVHAAGANRRTSRGGRRSSATAWAGSRPMKTSRSLIRPSSYERFRPNSRRCSAIAGTGPISALTTGSVPRSC
jgi:ectoine hydroxylase-related dioxygenase (phytanoyl-CoA dioxygenase family)